MENQLIRNFYNQFIKVASLSLLCLMFLVLISAVNAANFDSNPNTGNNIQDFINNPALGSDIVLDSENYENNIANLNITRDLTIKGNGQVNIKSTNGGILFNITSANVKITGLNISGYTTAIISDKGNISLIDNNITTSGNSINLTGTDSTGILIENNIIVSGATGVCVNFPSNSLVNISFIKNKITATSDSCISIYTLKNCNNNKVTLTFNDNILHGKANGIYLSSPSSVIDITLTNNNITGIGDIGVGLAIYGEQSNNTLTMTDNKIREMRSGVILKTKSSNNKVTLNNNNIKSYEIAVDIMGGNSNNTLTFKNNNINGTKNGFIFYGDGNNNMTIDNNTLTGQEVSGLVLGVYDSNNIITVSNNEIWGLKNTVYLMPYGSKNTINFVGNNIISNMSCITVVCEKDVSGLYLLNNTLNSNNAGLYFYAYGTNLKDIIVKGNTIIAKQTGILFGGADSTSVNVTVNYNRILAKIGLNYLAVSDSGSNFDYNWWGINDISEKIFGFETKNHYILKFVNLTDLSNVHVGDKVTFALLVLNTTLTNVGVENLPYFVINGTFNGVEFETTLDELFIYELIVLKEGIQYLEATLDDQDADISFEGFVVEETETPDDGSNGTDEEINSNIPDTNNEENNVIDSKTKKGKNIVPDKNSSEEVGDITDDEIDSSSDVLTSYAGMKSTGVPIAILLILAIFGLVSYKRKR